MAYKILCMDELGLTKLQLSPKPKGPDIQVINVKDEVEIKNALESNYFSVLLCVIHSESFRELEYVSGIKQRVEYKETPVIVISKYADRKCIVKAAELGAQEFIVQPFDKNVLFTKILKVLGWKSVTPTESESPDEDLISFTFSEMFNKEIKAASRGAYPVSVLMGTVVSQIPLNNNEQELNEITANLHKIIKAKVRDTDTVFYNGNGRITILLPFADCSGVKVVEEKVKNLFENHSMLKPVNIGYKLIMVAVSFPEDGKIQQKLLEMLNNSLDKNVKKQFQNISGM